MIIVKQPLKLWLLVSLSLFAFAGNSVLCRLALGNQTIDAMSFTAIRLASGIFMMLLIVWFQYVRNNEHNKNSLSLYTKGNWLAAIALFIYALCFSLAYITLDTGIGALILFASVQLSMILIGVFSGNKVSIREIVGILMAFVGFVYLLFPSLSTPSLYGFILMTISGIAWGVYTLQGRGSINPIQDTAINFFKTLPFILLILIININSSQLTNYGVWLAICSGVITSAIGYTIWYVVLPTLRITQAAVLQLLVPIFAAIGGIIFAGEQISGRLIIAAVLVLGGILQVVFSRKTEKDLHLRKHQ